MGLIKNDKCLIESVNYNLPFETPQQPTKMFADIDDNLLFTSNNKLCYTEYSILNGQICYSLNNCGRNLYDVLKNKLGKGDENREFIIQTGKIHSFLDILIKIIPDLKFRFKFMDIQQQIAWTCCDNWQSTSHYTNTYTNDTLRIYTNYNFIINIFNVHEASTLYAKIYGPKCGSTVALAQINNLDYELITFTDVGYNITRHVCNTSQLDTFSWPAFPLVKKTLPAVYFEYLLENNQNYKLENAIFAAQEHQATLEATIKTQTDQQATLEATIKTQTDQQATLEAQMQELAAELLKQHSHHTSFVENHTSILTEMREKLQYLQQLHIADEATIADLKTKADTLDMQKNVLQFQLATAELTTTTLEERIKELMIENVKLADIQSPTGITKDVPKQLCLIM